MAILVFDSAPLSAFARARQLPALDALTSGDDRVTTTGVIAELRQGLRDHPELQEAAALTDDDAAVQVGRERGVRVYRTLALVARGIRRAVLAEANAEALVDDLIRAGGRFPFRSGEFIKWAREQGLLVPTGSGRG